MTIKERDKLAEENTKLKDLVKALESQMKEKIELLKKRLKKRKLK